MNGSFAMVSSFDLLRCATAVTRVTQLNRDSLDGGLDGANIAQGDGVLQARASPSAADALRRLSASRRGPICGEFLVIKTHLSRGFRRTRNTERLTLTRLLHPYRYGATNA
jgi:hypothetical protein